MPTKPANPCRDPRCAASAAPGRAWCGAHQPQARLPAQAIDAARGSAASRGYGHKWRIQSLAFRVRHPVCGGYLVRGPGWTPELGKAYARAREGFSAKNAPVAFLGSPERMQFCALPGENSTPAAYILHRSDCRALTQMVEHIEPHRGNEALFWSESNWQNCCKQCGDIKTAKHDGGFRGAAKKPVAVAVGFEGGVA